MRLFATAVLFLVLAACGEDAPAEDSAVPDTAPVASAQAPGEDEAGEARPERIYYNLTRFDWYRQGEPLRVDGTAYQPEGKPVAAPARQLREAGNYQGVTYYRLIDGEPSTPLVYVPVYEGYWQPFAPVE